MNEYNFEAKEQKILRTRDLLFDYFYNDKFLGFITFLSTYVIVQFLYLLENFYWLDLITKLIPILIIVGLYRFYNEAKKRDASNKGLNIAVFGINLHLIINTFIITIIIFLLIQFIFQATFLFIVVVLSVFVSVINLQGIYYISKSLSTIRDYFHNGRLSSEFTHSFSKATNRLLISGIINILTFLLTLFNKEASEASVTNVKYIKIISLGNYSELNKILLTIIDLALPFIIAKVIDNTKVGIENINNIANSE